MPGAPVRDPGYPCGSEPPLRSLLDLRSGGRRPNDGDLALLRLIGLRQPQLEDAVLEAGLRRVGLHRARQGNLTVEAAGAALVPMVAALLDPVLSVELTLD